MSQDSFSRYEQLIDFLTKEHKLGAAKTFDPFLTLSFLTLSVIPELKITDKGLFSFSNFQFDPTFVKNR